jgi:ribosomal protein S18 acetylase RimI-like enzyme
MAPWTTRRVDPVAEPATLEAMDGVMQRAYGVSSFRSSIDRFVAAQADGLAVIEADGRVVATGCCVAYPTGRFGWVGLIATEPAFERRGLATAITEHLSAVLAAHDCASVLDASAAGAPVYARLGFTDHGLTTVMTLGDHVSVGFPGGARCATIAAADIDELVAFDAARFGGERAALIAKLVDQHPDRTFLVRSAGAISGYLVAQESTLAPVLADDTETLTALIATAVELPYSTRPRINVPPDSEHLTTLARCGFEQRRQLRHMHRGIGGLPGKRSAVAGMVSLGEG